MWWEGSLCKTTRNVYLLRHCGPTVPVSFHSRTACTLNHSMDILFPGTILNQGQVKSASLWPQSLFLTVFCNDKHPLHSVAINWVGFIFAFLLGTGHMCPKLWKREERGKHRKTEGRSEHPQGGKHSLHILPNLPRLQVRTPSRTTISGWECRRGMVLRPGRRCTSTQTHQPWGP